jgi:hypothetical protein
MERAGIDIIAGRFRHARGCAQAQPSSSRLQEALVSATRAVRAGGTQVATTSGTAHESPSCAWVLAFVRMGARRRACGRDTSR